MLRSEWNMENETPRELLQYNIFSVSLCSNFNRDGVGNEQDKFLQLKLISRCIPRLQYFAVTGQTQSEYLAIVN